MLTIEHLDLPPDDFLQHETEDAAYYRAYQASGIPGFTFGYCAVARNGHRVAVVPYFLTHFAADTMVPDGWLKRALAPIRLRMACVGHPYADGQIDGECSAEVLDAVTQYLRGKASLVVYKGFGADLPLPGYVQVRGLPNTLLAVTPTFWSDMTHNRRKNLRRKLKAAESLRIVVRTDITRAEAEQIHALYLNMHLRAAAKFERVPVDYWLQMTTVCRYLLAYEDERLIGFVQLLRKKPRMVAHYGGLDYERSTPYGLYYVFVIKAAELAAAEGYTSVDYGGTAYTFKKLMGCELVESWNYYSHANPVVHWVLSRARHLFEPSEEELK